MKNNKTLIKRILILTLFALMVFSFFGLKGRKINNNFNQSIQQTTITNDDEYTGRKKDSEWGVGSGIEWKDHYFAPYVDLAGWAPLPAVAGTPDLAGVYMPNSGANYFNLAFINYPPSGGEQWCWGGFPTYTYGSGDAHETEIENQMKKVRAKGGDIAVSFGGNTDLGNAVAPWMLSSESKLVSVYEEIINGYGLTRIDLDVEGNNEVLSNNITNAKAIKQVQKDTGVEVTLTLPTLASGLDANGLSILDAYLDEGVELTKVNVMAMLLWGGDQGDLDIQALEGLQKQLITEYGKHGTTLTDEQAYKLVGSTNSIGTESGKLFDTSDTKDVTDFAKENDIGELSFWVANRDSGDIGGFTTTPLWAYSKIYRDFADHDDSGGGDKTPPTVPTGLAADGEATVSTIPIKWTKSTDDVGVDSYNVNVKDTATAGSTYSKTFSTPASDNPTFTINDSLEAGTEYDITVNAKDAAGNTSADSSSITLSTASAADLPPGDITTLEQKEGTLSSDSLTLQWNPVTDPDAGDHVHYKIKKDTDATIEVTSGNTEYKFDNLTSSTSYNIKVWAEDDSGLSGGSKEASFETEGVNTPPPDIEEGTFVQKSGSESSTSLTLQWDAVTDPDAGDTVSYVIKIDNGPDAGVEKTTTSTEYTFSQLTASTNYNVEVWAVDSSGASSLNHTTKTFTTEEDTGNTPPTDVDSSLRPDTITSDSIKLKWNQSTDADGDDVNYKATIKGSGDVKDIEHPADAFSPVEYTFTNLTDNTSYDFEVWAVDSRGLPSVNKTELSNIKTKQSPPTDLTGLKQDSADETSISISWNPSTDKHLSVSYVIKSNGTQIDKISTTSYVLTGLNPGTDYTIEVTPVNSDNLFGNSQTITGHTKPITGNNPPTDVETNTFIQKIGTEAEDSLTLQWNPSTDPDTGDTVSYILSIDKGPDSGSEITESTTSHKFTNLTESTEYSITIWAIDNHNLKSLNSTVKTFKTEESKGESPPDVDEDTFVDSGDNTDPKSLTLSWAAVPDTLNNSVSNNGVTYSLVINKGPNAGQIMSTSETTYTFIGLSPSTTYSIELWSVSSTGVESKDHIIKEFRTPKGLNVKNKNFRNNIIIISISSLLLLTAIILIIIL